VNEVFHDEKTSAFHRESFESLSTDEDLIEEVALTGTREPVKESHLEPSINTKYYHSADWTFHQIL